MTESILAIEANKYGPAMLRVYDRDDLTTLIGELEIVSGEVRRVMDGVGNGAATIPWSAFADEYLAAGRVGTIVQWDAENDYNTGQFMPYGTFQFKKFERRADRDGIVYVTVSGEDLLDELARKPISGDLGTATAISTTGGLTNGTSTATVSEAADTNADVVVINDSNKFNVTDQIVITLNDGRAWETVVTDRAFKRMHIRDRLPAPANVGNGVTRRPRKLHVASTDGFAKGQVVTITYTSGGTPHTVETIIEDVKHDGKDIILRDPLSDDLTVSQATIVAHKYAATGDYLDQIEPLLGNWTISVQAGHGTTAVKGMVREKALTALQELAKDTDCHFFVAELTDAKPNRYIRWNKAWGNFHSLNIVTPAPDDYSKVDDPEYAIPVDAFSMEDEWDLVTAIVPKGGSDAVSLTKCSPAALAAVPAGIEVVTADLGLYGRPYLYHSGMVVEHGFIFEDVSFQDVQPADESALAIEAASDTLLHQAIAELQKRAQTPRKLTMTVTANRPIYPTQLVNVNITRDPYAEKPYGMPWTIAGWYYVVEVTTRLGTSEPFEGIALYDLTLMREDDTITLPKPIRQAERIVSAVRSAEREQPQKAKPGRVKIVEEYINVLDTGARGDYITDDSDGFHKAIDLAKNAGGGVIYVPPGRYRANISIQANNITINGFGDAHGGYTSVSHIAPYDYNQPVFTIGSRTAYWRGVSLNNLTIDGNTGGSWGKYGVWYQGAYQCYSNNLTISNFDNWGLLCGNLDDDGATVSTVPCSFIFFNNINISCGARPTLSGALRIRHPNCASSGVYTTAIGLSNVSIHGPNLTGDGAAIYMEGGQAFLNNAYVEGLHERGIRLDPGGGGYYGASMPLVYCSNVIVDSAESTDHLVLLADNNKPLSEFMPGSVSVDGYIRDHDPTTLAADWTSGSTISVADIGKLKPGDHALIQHNLGGWINVLVASVSGTPGGPGTAVLETTMVSPYEAYTGAAVYGGHRIRGFSYPYLSHMIWPYVQGRIRLGSWRSLVDDHEIYAESRIAMRLNSVGTVNVVAGNDVYLEATDEVILFGRDGVKINGNGIFIQLLGLPTTDPGTSGYLWNDSGTLRIS